MGAARGSIEPIRRTAGGSTYGNRIFVGRESRGRVRIDVQVEKIEEGSVRDGIGGAGQQSGRQDRLEVVSVDCGLWAVGCGR